jgi:5-methylcytosine-specific restriction protein A
MPMKPRRRCTVSLCGQDATPGASYCATHAREDYRASDSTRIRGSRLQRLRKQLFMRFPLCVTCQAAGRVTMATIRDHVVPIAEGGTEDDRNVQALCQGCSDTKTAAESERGRARVRAESA